VTGVAAQTGGTDWVTPVATLLAVFIGGVLSWVVQARLAQRRADFEREAQVKADERLINTNARAAARVLQADFLAATHLLKSMVERQRWLSFYTLAAASWGTGQASLAKRLDPAAWIAVAEVAIQLRALDDLMKAAIADGGPQARASSVALTQAINDRLESVRRDTEKAYNLLADVAETPRISDLDQVSERSALRTLM
jgi:hypothetical protein